MASAFRDTLGFFADIGIYDVVLPFLLIFTIVFAILEKSKIFGTAKVDGTEYTKKNLNAMVAFVAAFFVVGSTQLVAVISETLANVVMLLLFFFFTILLWASFHEDKPFFLKEDSRWNKAFMWIAFIGVILIFLHAFNILPFAFGYVTTYWNSVTISSILLLIIVIAIMMWITKEPGKAKQGG